MSRGRRGGWRLAGALVLGVALVATLGVLAFRGLGRWLIVADALAPARAVVILRGHYPFRAIEAGAIYRQGWAPEVWLTRTHADAAAEALRRLGMTAGTEDVMNRELLGRLAVPADAIRLLGGAVANTADEVKLVAAELRSAGGGAVIIVTSKPHTRRVRAAWRALVGERPAAIVRYASDDPFHADRWWRYTPDALSVTRETFGLLRVWTGFPPPAGEGE